MKGKGIHVFNKIETLEELMRTYLEEDNTSSSMIKSMFEGEAAESKKRQFRIRDFQTAHSSKSNYSFIIQKYLERPLLIDGRKFDIRVWVLFTHEFKVFFFKEGYVRTSSSQYSLKEDTFGNSNIHLTNNAIQKYGEDYGKYEDGNQLSFKFLNTYITRMGGKFEDILAEMKKMIKMTALSVRKKINKTHRQCCF